MVMTPEESINHAPPGLISTLEQHKGYVPPEVVNLFLKGVALWEQGKYQEALEAFDQTLKHEMDIPEAWYNKGVVLWQLGKPSEAQEAFQKTFELKGCLSDRGAALYSAWSTLALAQGVDSLLNQNSRTFEKSGLKYIDILEKAQQDDMGQVVGDALTQLRAQAKQDGESEAIEELELLIRLLSINDPFEGWHALTKEISKVWPEGVSAVDAIREQRDEWKG